MGILAFMADASAFRKEELPDSLWLFAYGQKDGKSGLRLAYSADGTIWNDIADRREVVKSDFGPWGSYKKMFDPELFSTPRGWALRWFVSDRRETVGFVETQDFISWKPQIYEVKEKSSRFLLPGFKRGEKTVVSIDGKKYSGTKLKVGKSVVEKLLDFGKQVKANDLLYAELMKDDKTRFGSLKPLRVKINSGSKSSYPISDKLIGIFFEDISNAADGGLYAELIQNRDFEYNPKDCGRAGWGPSYAWSLKKNGVACDLPIREKDPVHKNNSHYIHIDGAGIHQLTNAGFDGISVKKGEKYDFSLYGKVPSGKGKAVIEVSLVDTLGNRVAKGKVSVSSKDWRRYDVVLVPLQTISNCILSLDVPEGASADLDMISLFPEDTYKGRKNGLRKDLAQALADLKPRFVRFPGGCVAHGDGIDNIYDWKGSVGPLYARKPLRNFWGYHQTRGLGYHEYFQFCEDIGAEPLPVVAAGVPCQNSGSASHYSTNELTSKGQQCGIPLEDMDEYIQDIFDLIEYANGGTDTKWGRLRAEAGHPEPFNLKYIGIGNEDMITEVFEERFKMIHDAMKRHHPEITVIGTVGPFYEGTDYDRGYEFARKENVAMVDEHYYVAPGWLINNQNYYDGYDRKGPKVYLGEYASHLPGRPNNLEAALTIALYLTSVERNGDVVAMTSYAPLLAKEEHVNWRPDLIFFNNDEITLTPDYYVQKLYGNNSGDEYIPSEVSLDSEDEKVMKRFGHSVVRDRNSGDIIVKYANLLPIEIDLNESLEKIGVSAGEAQVFEIKGSPDAADVKPAVRTMEIRDGNLELMLAPYSFTVVRISYKK